MIGPVGLEHPILLGLLALIIPVLLIGIRQDKGFKKFITATKAVSICLIVLAAASPFIQVEEQLNKDPELTMLVDNSRSAELIEESEIKFEDVKLDTKVIASGNQSNLNQGIIRNLQKNTAYLVLSDLQSSESLQPAVDRARQINATLNILKPEMDEDASISLSGPESTVPDAENVYTVRTYSTADGEKPKPELRLDGEKVDLEKKSPNRYIFEKNFQEKGRHTLEARISTEDRFNSNNRFYKTVKVAEKPKILIIGSKGALESRLSEFYKLEYRNELPNDLSDYYAVISKEKIDDEEVADYVARGNGLITTGEIKEDNTILPIELSESDQDSKGAKIMLVIDISTSTGSDGSVKKSKKIAYSLAEKLPFNNKLGAVAYNQKSYPLSEPKPLATNRADLKTKISRLETGKNSFHHVGLEAAKEQMGSEGNIIMITDGKLTTYGLKQDTDRKSKRIASSLDPRLITVGVGEGKNEAFLRDLASRGDGIYMDAKQSGRLNFMFKAGGAQQRTGRLVKVNRYHFITDGLPKLNTRTADYESVKPKPGADLLVTSTGGKPFLTTWRYGLGRVASFSGGTADLGTTVSTDPRLVTRSVSWAVGQPERKKDKWLRIKDGREDENVQVRASYKTGDLKRQGEELYTKEISPESAGFHRFQDKVFGYSYNPEIEQIGYNSENQFLATKTGGKVFGAEEKEKIKDTVKNFNNRKVTEKKSLSAYLLLAALIVFLAEVGYRKRKGKK